MAVANVGLGLVMSKPLPGGYIDGPFVIFRRDILEDPNIPGPGRMVYSAVASYATPDGRAWPSLESIAERSGFSSSTVARELNRLEAEGYLVRRRRRMVGNKRLTTMYYLGDPPSDLKEPRPDPPKPKPDANITPHLTREDYKNPKAEAALSELTTKFGSGQHKA